MYLYNATAAEQHNQHITFKLWNSLPQPEATAATAAEQHTYVCLSGLQHSTFPQRLPVWARQQKSVVHWSSIFLSSVYNVHIQVFMRVRTALARRLLHGVSCVGSTTKLRMCACTKQFQRLKTLLFHKQRCSTWQQSGFSNKKSI